MGDLEQECENALWELCDARERYPLQCADELDKCVKLQNDIHMAKVYEKSNIIGELPALKPTTNVNINHNQISFGHLDSKLENIMSKLHDLKAITDQIKREKSYWINKVLQD